MSATIFAMSVLPSLLASTTILRLPFSRKIWFGTVGFLDICKLTHRHPTERRLDQHVAKRLRRAHLVRQTHDHIEAPVSIDETGNISTIGKPFERFGDSCGLQAEERARS